jgi:hypothetical protein
MIIMHQNLYEIIWGDQQIHGTNFLRLNCLESKDWVMALFNSEILVYVRTT